MVFILGVPFQAPVSLFCLIEKWNKRETCMLIIFLLKSQEENMHFNYVITAKLYVLRCECVICSIKK